jgi:hypothetical protein
MYIYGLCVWVYVVWPMCMHMVCMYYVCGMYHAGHMYYVCGMYPIACMYYVCAYACVPFVWGMHPIAYISPTLRMSIFSIVLRYSSLFVNAQMSVLYF